MELQCKKSGIAISFLLFFVLISVSGFAQNFYSDIELIQKKKTQIPEKYRDRQVVFGFSDSERLWIRYNPVSVFFGSAMFVYQKYISQQISASCLYSPGCSEFSRMLIAEYGLIKGSFAAADRLMRCNSLARRDAQKVEKERYKGRIIEKTDMYKR